MIIYRAVIDDEASSEEVFRLAREYGLALGGGIRLDTVAASRHVPGSGCQNGGCHKRKQKQVS